MIDIKESNRIKSLYPDRLPIIVVPLNDKQPKINRNKYLVPKILTLDKFLAVVRNHIEVNKDEAIFFFFNKTMVSNNLLMEVVYDLYKNENGFLIVEYSLEQTFG